ncbi:EF-hand calcium-binding domain-containing protein 10 [Aplysia californica]|uniref:EF-hand calcium-binding domain-containing protein 10 n=1 Tax=Aplysia californica TaxID=6500 RepID=A0ABM0JRE0_APLCA|nr:EF-hand calcium-binding domain-containing protein 10 [Aplysia californica]
MADTERTGPKLRSEEATEYLDKHRVLELFNNLTSQLIYSRPDDPKAFLIESLEKLQKSRTSKLNYPCLFDESNISSVFGMLDPTGRGYVTVKQYQEAMITLGAKDYDENPHGSDIDRITIDIFLREAKLGLANASATFSEL